MILSSPLRKAAGTTTTTSSSSHSESSRSKRPRSVSPERQQPRKRPQLVLGRTHSFQQQQRPVQPQSSPFPSMYAVRSSLSMAIANAAQAPDTRMVLDYEDSFSAGNSGKDTSRGSHTSLDSRKALASKQCVTDGTTYDLAMSLSMLVDEPSYGVQQHIYTPPQSPTKHSLYSHTPANSSSSDISPDTPRRFDQSPASFSFHASSRHQGDDSNDGLSEHSRHQTPRKMALPPSPTRKKFRMGYKKGCIDCETRVAGHHSHIEYDYT